MEEGQRDELKEAFELLKEMRSVDYQKGFYRFISAISTQTETNKYIRLWHYVRNIAAILMPLFLLLNIYLLWPDHNIYSHKGGQHLLSMAEVNAIAGTNISYVLPDSTSVILRSGSRLTYDVNMTMDSKRIVSLVGEAYFKVKSDKQKPFYVKMNDIDVRVTGTEFDCNTNDHGNIGVTLVKGHVDILSQESSTGNNEQKQLSALVPDRHFCYHPGNKTYVVQTVDARKFTGWKDGLLFFDDDPMTEVVDKMSQWYGINIDISDKKIKEMRFTACFRDLSLHAVIDILDQSLNITSHYKIGYMNKDGTIVRDKLILTLKNQTKH